MEPSPLPPRLPNDTAPPARMLVTKYLIGETTPEESVRIEQWIAADLTRQSVIHVLQMWWKTRSESTSPAQVESALAAVMQRNQLFVRRDTARPDGIRRDTSAPNFPRPVWYAVAVLAAAIILFFGGWHIRGHWTDVRATQSMSTYATANGQRATITLPDGSIVSLNVASRLDVPADYVKGNHTVRLSGEALFTVLHHDATPLTVVAGAATTRVLGTSFVVRHYATDATTLVAVRDGKVAVRSAVLTATQRADVSQDGTTRLSRATAAQFSFATGVLTLNEMSFRDAITELNRWYDTDIRLGDPRLGDHQVKGEFAAGSLADISAILELTLNVHVVRNGRIVTLYPR